jgi:hypothetical protein
MYLERMQCVNDNIGEVDANGWPGYHSLVMGGIDSEPEAWGSHPAQKRQFLFAASSGERIKKNK